MKIQQLLFFEEPEFIVCLSLALYDDFGNWNDGKEDS